ncbi:MAG: ferredoxin [Ramlibacter sp.]|jgi:vanillate O-demethylase ferredoxin subunit|nr:ferredoxin [Ramlibacter sp.]
MNLIDRPATAPSSGAGVAGARLPVRVAARRIEALDIASFELVDPRGRELPSFSAGSHIDVHLAGGITRQYSLCNDPGENHRYRIAVLRDPGSRGGSVALHDGVQVGDLLEISAPRNHFHLAEEAQHSLLLAGGIGVTPILCMAQRLSATGASFEMHYGARSRERMAFADHVAASSFAARVHMHLDDGPAVQRYDLAALLAAPRPGVHMYVCGPKGFIDAALQTARGNGWPEDQLHYEFFAGDTGPGDAAESFEVRLARSGRVIKVDKEDTVTSALHACGIELETSCEQGVCGTCLTRVLDGVPDHRDLYLTPQERAANDQFLPCVSRSKSAVLVLDL